MGWSSGEDTARKLKRRVGVPNSVWEKNVLIFFAFLLYTNKLTTLQPSSVGKMN